MIHEITLNEYYPERSYFIQSFIVVVGLCELIRVAARDADIFFENYLDFLMYIYEYYLCHTIINQAHI